MFASQRKVLFDTPSSIIYERKFDTAIRDSFLKGLTARIEDNKLTAYDRMLLESPHLGCKIEDMQKSTTFMGKIMLTLLSKASYIKPTRDVYHKVINSWDIARSVTTTQLKYMMRQCYLPNKRSLAHHINGYNVKDLDTPEIYRLLDFNTWMLKIIEQSNMMYSIQVQKLGDHNKLAELMQHNHCRYDYLDLQMVWNHEIVVIIVQSTYYIVPKPCILMIQNKVSDLISIMVCISASLGGHYPNNTIDIVIGIVRELSRLQLRYKEKYYKIARVLEGLGTAETLTETEEWNNSEFLVNLCADLYQETGFDYMGSDLQMYITSCDIPLRHDIMCLSKIMGHPLVNMDKGSKKLYKNVNSQFEVNLLQIHRCVNYVKQNFIRNYIAKYSKWPACSLNSPNTPKALQMAFIYGKDPHSRFIESKYGKITVDDYVFVDLEKCMRFDKLENVIPYLKDKTITLLRSKVMTSYLSPRDKNESVASNWKETRLLLSYLLNPTMVHDHVAFLEKYTEVDDLGMLADYLCIRVVPKEGELKVEFRGFGCKTYEDRMRALCQEKNVMRYLDEFSDEQAMTLGELDIFRRLDTFRRMYKAFKGHQMLHIVIDASAWNNKFRKETVDNVMKPTLDQIFGTQIFGKTHEAFNNTLVYIPDRDTTYYWDGQAGGIEGLNQDTWVVVYLSQIKSALDQFGYRYHILCKGDDLRVTVAVPKPILEKMSMTVLKNNLVSELSKTMTGVGHTINVEESYGSSKYFAFSKYASLNLIELPQVFRKIQKVYGANNAFLPTLDDYIASTFSNAHSACKVGMTIVGPFMTAVFWSAYYLTMSSHYYKCTNDELTSLLMVPSMCGGFPIIYLHNMYVRAESDLLAPFLGLLEFCKTFNPIYYQHMLKFCRGKVAMPEDYEMLFRDPYSIPITRPKLPTSILRSAIKPVLKLKTRNQDVRELILASEDPQQEIINSILSSARPLDVKVLAGIYAATPKGVLDELLRKFESSRSVYELLILRYGRRRCAGLLRRVIASEWKLQEWRFKLIKETLVSDDITYVHLIRACPAESAHIIRQYLWRTEVVGITMPPLQHQIWTTTAYGDPENVWANKNHFVYKVSDISDRPPNCHREHYGTGDYDPFIGYTTRAGTTEPTVHFVEKDPIVQKIKNLIDLTSWTEKSTVDHDGNEVTSNARGLIEKVLHTFTDVPLAHLAPFAGQRKSGTVQHHIRAPSFKESIIPNTLLNFYTRFSGESNSHTTLRSSTLHFRVNFLHIYTYAAMIASLELEFSPNITTPEIFWVVTTDCEYCNTPIQEEPVRFDLTHLEHIHLHPLSMCKVGENAKEILKESIEDFNTDKLLLNAERGDLDKKTATYGLSQEMTDITWNLKTKLHDRYYATNLTDEGVSLLSRLLPQGRHREIGLTELKRCSINDLLDYIIMFISSHIAMKYRSASSIQIYSALQLTPGNELPWFGLVNYIYKAGKLNYLIRKIAESSMTNPPACFHTPSSAATYIGYASWRISNWRQDPLTLVVLSYYNQGTLIPHIRHVMFSSIWRTIFTNYLKPALLTVKSLKGAPMTDDIMYVLTSIIYIGAGYQALEESLPDIADRLTLNQVNTMNFNLPIDNLCLDLVMNLDGPDYILPEDSSALLSLVFQYLKKSECDVGTLLSFVEDHSDDVIDRVTTILNQSDIEIRYCTLADCIHVVRSDRAGDDSIEDDLEKMDPEVDRWIGVRTDLVYNIDFSKLPRPYISLPYDVSTHTLAPPHIEQVISPITTLHLNNRISYQILGVYNSSASKLHEILCSLGIATSRIYPRGCAVACLADGLGGFASILDTLLTKGIILYHTHPDTSDVEIYPESLYINGAPKNHVLVEHLNEGFTDMRMITTFTRMEQYNLRYGITTCDIDSYALGENDCLTIHMSLCCFFLRNSSPNGLFICAIPLTYPIVLAKILTYMSRACVSVNLTMPVSACKYEKAYLVCQGPIHVPTDYKTLDSPVNEVSCTKVNSFINVINREIIQLLGNTPTPIVIGPRYRNKVVSVAPYTGLLGYTYLESHLPEIEDISELKNVEYSKLCEIISPLIERRVNMARDVLSGRRKHTHIFGTYDFDTRAHRVYLLKRAMYLEGLKWAMTQARTYDSFSTTQHKAWEKYTTIIGEYPHRDQLHPVDDSHKEAIVHRDGTQYTSHFRPFLAGVSILMRICGFHMNPNEYNPARRD